MTKTIRKVFWVWQSHKEKAWLEEKAREGLILSKVGVFKYTFTVSEPEDLVYQFDFQIMNKEKEQEYLDIFSDWTMVGTVGNWYYFYKKREGEERDEIYGDVESKKKMLYRLMGLLSLIGFPLYYQLLVIFPNIDSAKMEFPSFYFFLQIVIMIFCLLYIYAMARIFGMITAYNRMIKE